MTEFYRTARSQDGFQARCKICYDKANPRRSYPPKNFEYEEQDFPSEKICKDCGISKSTSDFYQSRRYKCGFMPRCKQCHLIKYPSNKEAKRAYFQANKEKYESNRMWREYGITLADYDSIIARQNGGCGICGKPAEGVGRKLDIDHCHSTNQVRGALCNKCNQAIGLFKHDVEILKRAIEYLGRE